MTCSVVFDHKAVVALGLAGVGIVSFVKLDSVSVKAVWIHAIDSAKECVVAACGSR